MSSKQTFHCPPWLDRFMAKCQEIEAPLARTFNNKSPTNGCSSLNFTIKNTTRLEKFRNPRKRGAEQPGSVLRRLGVVWWTYVVELAGFSMNKGVRKSAK